MLSTAVFSVIATAASFSLSMVSTSSTTDDESHKFVVVVGSKVKIKERVFSQELSPLVLGAKFKNERQ
jgi:hypothetical protein